MPLSDNDYAEILTYLRALLQESRLGALDEKIVERVRGGSNSSYGDLIVYLKLLAAEVSLGSGQQLRSVLARLRDVVETESGEPVEGIRVTFTGGDSRVFQADHIDLGALSESPESEVLVSELHQLIEDLHNDRHQPPDAQDPP